MKLILISGKQGSGKTTLAKSLQLYLGKDECRIMSFASPLRVLVKRLKDEAVDIGIVEDADEIESRPLMQYLGTDWARAIDYDVWVKIVKKRMSVLSDATKYVVIDDMRFKNEFEAFPDAFKIRLECDEKIRIGRAKYWGDPSHKSECDLDYFAQSSSFDLNIETDGDKDIVSSCALYKFFIWEKLANR
jgi:phosphomevalonate kinase